MNISSRRQNLNVAVLLLVVFLALQASSLFPALDESPLIQAVVILSSKGIYELLVALIFWCIRSSATLMHWYWGRLYLNGLWSYEYSLNHKIYFGVWDISQDTDGLQVVGNGLDDEFRVRTIVRSVSPLIEEQGGYFVLNARNELSNDNARVFSKTTLLLDHPNRPWQLVMSMRATTEVFGGPSDRQLHANVVFTRHPKATSVEDVAALLRVRFGSDVKDDGDLPPSLKPPLASLTRGTDEPSVPET